MSCMTCGIEEDMSVQEPILFDKGTRPLLSDEVNNLVPNPLRDWTNFVSNPVCLHPKS